jgi:hypothetical protein
MVLIHEFKKLKEHCMLTNQRVIPKILADRKG